MTLFPSPPTHVLGESIRSIVWGNESLPVTQDFGTYNPDTAYMYDYAKDQGWPSGTHIGLDVGLPFGTNVYAAEGGEVIQSGPSPWFRPNPVWVRENDGQVAIYGHLSQDAVRTGERVTKGKLLGKSGEQDAGTGPHLHFELRDPDGTAVNPLSELSGTGTLTGTGSYGKSFGGDVAETAKKLTLRIFFFLAGTVIIVVGLYSITRG